MLLLLVSATEDTLDKLLPDFTDVTPSPTLSTIPPPSWPRMHGNIPSGSLPLRVWESVWQTPVAKILMRTSPALGGATSTVSRERGFLGSHATAARQLIGCEKEFRQSMLKGHLTSPSTPKWSSHHILSSDTESAYLLSNLFPSKPFIVFSRYKPFYSQSNW